MSLQLPEYYNKFNEKKKIMNGSYCNENIDISCLTNELYNLYSK